MSRKERAEAIRIITADMYDDAFDRLVHDMHKLEELGCKAECKKLDTILGKLENLCHALHNKVRELEG